MRRAWWQPCARGPVDNMTGIYPMAALTLIVGAACAMAYLATGSKDGRKYWPLLLLGLPLSFLINRLVKGPLIQAVVASTGVSPALDAASPLWFALFVLMTAPFFEELVKLLPLVLPVARRHLARPWSGLWAGLALGMSFGLGEAAYIAYGIAQAPQYQSMPSHLFTGYLFERLMVIFLHGFLTAIAASGLASSWGWAMLRLLVAMGLHALANSGIVLNHLSWIPLAWVQAPLLLAILVAVLYFERLRRRELAYAPSEDAPEKVYF